MQLLDPSGSDLVHEWALKGRVTQVKERLFQNRSMFILEAYVIASFHGICPPLNVLST